MAGMQIRSSTVPGLLELVSLHSASMSIIGSMVYFGHPVLLRTSGISYRILPERTVRRLGIKCRVVNKSLAEATLTKCHHSGESSRHSPLRRILNIKVDIIMSGFYSVLDEIYRNEPYYFISLIIIFEYA